MPATWKFILARAYDLLPIGELIHARGRTISLSLNNAGSASFNIPMDDELGNVIHPHVHALLVYRKGSTGAKLVWSGYVNTIEEDINNNRMTVNVTGWLDRLSKRMNHRKISVLNVDDAVLMAHLFWEASLPSIQYPSATDEYTVGTNSAVAPDGTTFYWPSGSKPNTPTLLKWGGTQPNEGVGGATAYVPQPSPGGLRSANWERYSINILQAMRDIMNSENGCDISIDPLTRFMYVHRKLMAVKPNIVFGYGWGPQNIAQIGRSIDGAIAVNWAIVTGGANTSQWAATDITSMLAYGPLEESLSLTDQSGTEANKILAAFVNEHVAVRKTPRQIYSFTPFNWTELSSVPEPFVDYTIGDLVTLGVVSKPRINVKINVRVFGMTFGIDEEGNEQIGQLQVSP